IYEKEKPPKKSRMIFRTEEETFLEELRITVAFDKDLEPKKINHTHTLVKDFVLSQYTEQTQLNFMDIPLIKKKKENNAAGEQGPMNLVKKYLPWILLGLLVLW